VIARGDDDEHDERRVDDPEEAQRRAATVRDEARADDERVAHMHARDRGERVVERAHETVVQVDAPAGDRVRDAEPRFARRRRRKHEVADQRERAREQQRRPDERKRAGTAAVQPDQVRAGGRKVQRQIEEPERSDHSRKGLCGGLDVRLGEDVKRPLQRRDIVRVPDRNHAIAGDQPARRFVQRVQSENPGRLDDERVPLGSPAERQPDPRTRHAVASARSSGSPSRSASW
jgi:hypothetical protein